VVPSVTVALPGTLEVTCPLSTGFVADLVTGQMVVLTAIVLVITAVGVPGRSGQSVTVGAQEVIVTSLVL